MVGMPPVNTVQANMVQAIAHPATKDHRPTHLAPIQVVNNRAVHRTILAHMAPTTVAITTGVPTPLAAPTCLHRIRRDKALRIQSPLITTATIPTIATDRSPSRQRGQSTQRPRFASRPFITGGATRSAYTNALPPRLKITSLRPRLIAINVACATRRGGQLPMLLDF